jgi:hypothetical protein
MAVANLPFVGDVLMVRNAGQIARHSTTIRAVAEAPSCSGSPSWK